MLFGGELTDVWTKNKIQGYHMAAEYWNATHIQTLLEPVWRAIGVALLDV